MENEVLFPIESGTPQGGVVSPPLANIALHGMEQLIVDKFPEKRNSKKNFLWPKLIRYADDLSVFHKDRNTAEQCKEELEIWLAKIELSLKPSKTRIVHSLEPDENQERGSDFLGMHIGQHKVGRTQAGKSRQKIPL